MVNQGPAQPNKSGFFYGYVVVLVSLIIMTLTFGVNYSFGVFFTPLTAAFGWTKAATSAAYSMKTLIAGFLGIFAGRLTDRFSAKVVAISGAIFLGLGCLLMYKVNAIWQFYLIYGLLLSAGVGGCWPSLMATVPKWFVRQRGLMTGIVASGIGLGTITIPPLMAVTIPLYGWRTSYIIMGAIVFVGIIVSAQFMRRDPHQMGQNLYGAEKTGQATASTRAQPVSFRKMARSWLFWVMCILYFLFGYCLHSIMVHIVPHAIELGISPETAAGVLGTIGAMSVVSKLIMGTASDRLGVRPSLAYGFILLIAALVWVQFANSTWMLLAFAVMFGFAYGGIMTMQSLLAAELFGLSSLGQVLGGVSFIYTVGSSLGPLASGYIFDLTDSYRFAFAICVLCAVVALIFVLAVFGKKKKQAL